MKIEGYGSVGKSSATTKKKGASSVTGGDFMGLLGADTEITAQAASLASDIQPVTTLDALLSLQEMPEDEVRNRKAVQDSKNTLEALETLRLALLTDNIPEHLLGTLSHVIAMQKQRAALDPRLTSIIEDIELRAAVELAKLERASV